MPRRKVLDISRNRKKIQYLKRRMSKWTYSNPCKFPWRTTKSKFHALMAEILLQRTRAEQVIPVYKDFIKVFPSAKALSDVSLKSISKLILPLGLSWRAQKIMKLGSVLWKNYRGRVPSDLSELLELPGVGPYAASAFLSFHSGKRAVLIDSNTVRLYGRFFGFDVHPETRRDLQLKDLVEKLTPYKGFKTFNYSVLDLGRNICKFRPNCCDCPLFRKCSYYQKEKK